MINSGKEISYAIMLDDNGNEYMVSPDPSDEFDDVVDGSDHYGSGNPYPDSSWEDK